MLAGGVAIFSGYLIYPVVRFLTPPPMPLDAQSKVQVATVDELKPNSAKFFRFLDKPAVLVRLPDGNYEALSSLIRPAQSNGGTERSFPESQGRYCCQGQPDWAAILDASGF